MTDQIPASLFKYQPYNVQSLDNLKNRVIWFSNPQALTIPSIYQ